MTEHAETRVRVGDSIDLRQSDNYGEYFQCVTVVELLDDFLVRVLSLDSRSYEEVLFSTAEGHVITGPCSKVFRVDPFGAGKVWSRVKDLSRPHSLGRYWTARPARPTERKAILQLSESLREQLGNPTVAFCLPRMQFKKLTRGWEMNSAELEQRLATFQSQRAELRRLLEDERCAMPVLDERLCTVERSSSERAMCNTEACLVQGENSGQTSA